MGIRRRGNHPSGIGTIDQRGRHVRQLWNRELKRIERHTFQHVLIWEAANGPVSKGFVIHHKDGDSGNNALENLECITQADHMRYHRGWRKGDDGRWLKQCRDCGDEKDAETEFYWLKNGHPKPRCKPCTVKYNMELERKADERGYKLPPGRPAYAVSHNGWPARK